MLKYEMHTEEEWKQIISDYKNSGLSAAKYIAENHLEKNKFYEMKKKYFELHPSALPTGFVELVPKTNSADSIKIMKNGFTIEFTKDVDLSLFKELLGALNDI